jgi:elongation factor G
VIAANEGVDDPTKSLWLECAQVGMPRAVVITKLDHARANYENALAAAQEAFGDKVLPLYLAADTPCTGLIGLLSQTHYEYSDGKRTTTHAGRSYSDAIELHGALIEESSESEDETLMTLPRWPGDRPVRADRRPGEGCRPRVVLSGGTSMQRAASER